jgi:uncharacterized protein (DUF2384 family)
MTEEAGEGQRTGAWKGYRKHGGDRPRLPIDQAKRQGAIVTLALALLSGREEAMSFLNTTNKVLEARPIDLAMRSDLGFLRVETLLRKLSATPAKT